ncbi:MAG: hypothetical protein Q9208_001206 [Pyrenodesmia sp. 3 TL-2023]
MKDFWPQTNDFLSIPIFACVFSLPSGQRQLHENLAGDNFMTSQTRQANLLTAESRKVISDLGLENSVAAFHRQKDSDQLSPSAEIAMEEDYIMNDDDGYKRDIQEPDKGDRQHLRKQYPEEREQGRQLMQAETG